MTAEYIIGIDLGTTNSVLSYAKLGTDEPHIELLPIPQLVAAGTVESRTSLPSFIYLGHEQEAQGDTFALPWGTPGAFAVGEMARRQAADVPDRTVGAAKSWLCHSRVNRHDPILPWNAPDDVPKISPVTAAQRYLEHMVAAWTATFPDAPIADQQVVLTVPASFDASARELTHEAAMAAGLPSGMVLLEEPQAAVYSWLNSFGDRWRQVLGTDDCLLVCDVGGGTTDLTLVSVEQEEGQLVLNRMAVGDHLLVGGDNMDLALAHFAAGRFDEQGVKLDPWQSVSLWHSCRTAKETLMVPDGPESHTISVLGRGSRLIGGTVSVDVERKPVSSLLLDGFFPECDLTDRPARHRASGFRELGLPFEQDTSITRHIAAFLNTHGDDGQPVRPSRVLFNGGVFKAAALRSRMLETLGNWFDHQKPVELEGEHDLDFAVSRGATFYGWTKQRGGMRIRGGTARAYYVGIETAGLAIPGMPRPLNALCVAPMGMEEGTEADVPSEEIGLIVGETAHFRFFSSSQRKDDRSGDLLRRWDEAELVETDSMEMELAADESIAEEYVPVRFLTRVTELGMLELWCRCTASDKQWKLEFNVREKDS